MSIDTLAYKNTSNNSFYNIVQGQYRSPKTVLAGGDAKLSTTVFKHGTSSVYLDGIGDFVRVLTSTDFAWGTSDWTYEGWYQRTATLTTNFFFDQRQAGGSISPIVYYTGGTIHYYVTTNRISHTITFDLNTWYHIAVSKSGTSTRMFINGVQVGITYNDTNVYVQGSDLFIGATTPGNSTWPGYIDDFRVSNTARYTTNFTPPTDTFQNDGNTVLLLRMDGDNNSTIITDTVV